MLTAEFERTLHATFVAARTRRQKVLTVEDLLLGLLDDVDAKKVLQALNANLEDMRTALVSFVSTNVTPVPGTDAVDTEPTLGFQRVIQRAIMHVQSTGAGGKAQVNGARCLVAVFGEKDSDAVKVLHSQGITRLDVVNYIVYGITTVALQESGENALTELAADVQVAAENIKAPVNVHPGDKKADGLRLFVSYSHTDQGCLNRLLVHLKPLERQGLIDCWSDKKIRAGDKWKDQITSNLDRAAVAILLVSADFLASDFIVNNELPPLLMRAEANGLRIVPVILKPCGFHRDKVLQNFQAINDPAAPLMGMPEIAQEGVYDLVAEEVHREIEARRKLGQRSPA